MTTSTTESQETHLPKFVRSTIKVWSELGNSICTCCFSWFQAINHGEREIKMHLMKLNHLLTNSTFFSQSERFEKKRETVEVYAVGRSKC